MKSKNIFIAIIVVVIAIALYLFSSGNLSTNIFSSTKSVAILQTNYGNIKIKLLHEDVPTIAKNFERIANDGKYNNNVFHRVINGFMIQGGDYENQDGTGGESDNGGYIVDEFSDNLSHVRGMVSMANKGPDTNGSQFFIVQKDSKFLDGNYSIFGQVMEGIEVVDKIAEVETDLGDKPMQPVIIEKVILMD